MRIRSYLAILVLACILGAYTLEQVLSFHFNNVQALAEKHTTSLLWAKDLERIENNASQFLVSTDLVVASGNTYLIFGAKNMGNYLIEEINIVQINNQFSNLNIKFKNMIIQIEKINEYLDLIGNMPAKELDVYLSALLQDYDQVTLKFSQHIQYVMQESQKNIQKDETFLKQEKYFMNKIGWIARGGFLIVIVFIWWWANRRICKPLNSLINSSNNALTGSTFKSATNAPLEIITLSNDFKLLTKTLSHQATHDPLTELFNRRAFERYLLDAMNANNQEMFLCFIDLDYFKTINDTCGHSAGDKILVNVAMILKECVRNYDTPARLGGDEFAIIIQDCGVKKALQIANTIKKRIHGITYKWEDETVHLSASIGVAQNSETISMSELLHNADDACSLAKSLGRNCVQLFDYSSVKSKELSLDMLSIHQINNAIDNDLFVLYKQNINSLQHENTGKRFEVLLRMIGSKGEVIEPERFLPIAVRYQLSCKIDQWVINRVCDYLTEHPWKLDQVEMVSINLSVQSLTDKELMNFIIKKITSNRLAPEKFCFEVTEVEGAMTNEKAIHFMNEIKSIGCKFSLDHFSGDHSSYEYIKKLPFNEVKIDGDVVNNMMNNKIDLTTVETLCELAQSQGQIITAECVEQAEVISVITDLGVDYVQGFYYDKPKPLDL